MLDIVQSVVKDMGGECELNIVKGYPPLLNDETVTQKNNGIISKGKYSIDKNIIKLTNLKREDGKRSFGKRTLVFNDKTTIVISNTAVKAVFKKQVLSQ